MAELSWPTRRKLQEQQYQTFKGDDVTAGACRIITTGTPIENHLGELWNLFRFINPGLLGSQERFNERFANPIELHQDEQAKHRLKSLIRPFILRRLSVKS